MADDAFTEAAGKAIGGIMAAVEAVERGMPRSAACLLAVAILQAEAARAALVSPPAA